MIRFPWLEGDEGHRFLERRAATAAQVFAEQALPDRLAREWTDFQASPSGDSRIMGSLATLAAELSILCAAGHTGCPVSEETWRRADRDFLSFLPGVTELTCQGRTNSPRWNSDLMTAEIGVSLAMALYLDTAGKLDRARLEGFVRERCLRPVLQDWLEDGTRLHSLDTMGHNWWSVMVGGAGIIAVALGEKDITETITDRLLEWFHHPGNAFARKRPTFGKDGDFVESFHYADYALCHPVVFSRLHPKFRLVPDALNRRQIRGLARWLGHSILPSFSVYPQMRFGDIQFYDGFLGPVWQTVARLAEDESLMETAHRIRPEPRHLLEMLFWEPPRQKISRPRETPALEVFSNSGLAFLRQADLSLAVRAGDCWGHNHLDAGSFVFHQNGETWIDDCGACQYGRPEYTEYYVSASAHNVAYAPALSPSPPRAAYEGLPQRADYLLRANRNGLQVLCADTGILSGGALARSHRWFLGLDAGAILVWDDLAAYREEEFVFQLHSTAGVENDPRSSPALRHGGKRCALDFYSDSPCRLEVEAALMGQLPDRGDGLIRDAEGTVLRWRTRAERVKFGLLLCAHPHGTEWRETKAGGTECRVTLGDVVWRIWFNPRADGRVMHENSIASWNGFQTDAYALVLREERRQNWMGMLSGSFLRRDGVSLIENLEKRPLAGAKVRRDGAAAIVAKGGDARIFA